ncbi:hypothetical protein J1605_005499 [Eschrichtius robustus]|uniref:MiT/TFE transcription factors N-terminal domain-containing protein n=1 Tax=Eschrichtius robustus TaxID=9764 RepID=A0AB34HB80_ESCRO|nr:hypothetical protein J1605_005499 [Eschrichtius robustus]
MEALRVQMFMPCSFESLYLSSEEHPGASKPPISSSSMTSRILLRQQLMREQMQEQERREQQQKLQAAQFMQQRVPVSQTPAINVSVPTTLPSATQVPMEVLKAGIQNLNSITLAKRSKDRCSTSQIGLPWSP